MRTGTPPVLTATRILRRERTAATTLITAGLRLRGMAPCSGPRRRPGTTLGATLLLLAVTLSGCSDDGGGDGPAPLTDEGDEAAALTVPTWGVGDYWEWRFTAPDGSTGGWTSVVTDDAGSDFIIDVDGKDTAFFHALDPISTVGAQRKSDLAGSQAAGAVEFWKWPLEDGRTWSMRLDGIDYDMTAHVQDDGTVHVMGMEGDLPGVQYAFDPANKWFSFIQYYQNGTETFRAEVAEHGSNWTGDVYRYTLKDMDSRSYEGAIADVDTFTMEEGVTDLYLTASISCSEPGNVVLGFGPAENAGSVVTGDDAPGYSADLQCPAEVADNGVIAEAPFEGTWGIVYEATSQDAATELVAIYRTLETIPVGQT